MSGLATQSSVKAEAGADDDFMLDEEDVQEDGVSYKARPQLLKPGTFLRTLAYLMRGLDEEIININPEYQREVVWTADRMTGLINSLMENYYIPPIILNKKTPPSGDSPGKAFTLVCVDGKQRLSSVKAFIKGMIPCQDHRGEKWWFCQTASGRRRKVLPEQARNEFLSKEFMTVEYADLSQEQEEDLFARVQMGVQLSLAEKMRASTGPWQELARCYVDDFPAIYFLLKDRARAKDFQMTLSCFSQIVEVMHPTAANGVPTLKTNHLQLPKLLENKGAVDDGLKSHLASVWNTFQELIDLDPNTFTNVEKTLSGVQTFAPVEMVAVTVMISMYSETRNNRLLIGDIQALREELRAHFVDLRLNTHTWKFIWDYLDNLEQIRGAVDRTTVQHTVKTIPASIQQQAPVPVPTGVARRRPMVLPASGNAEPQRIKAEGRAATPTTELRVAKRQRYNPTPSSQSLQSTPTTSPLATVYSTPLPNPGSHVNIASHLMLSAQPLDLLAPTVQKMRKNQGLRNKLQISNPISLSNTEQPTPTTAAKTQQNRTPLITRYQAPPAPMGTQSPVALASPMGDGSSTIRSPSQLVSRFESKASLRSPPQYHNVIDLTGPDKQERQGLLSSFRASTSATDRNANA